MCACKRASVRACVCACVREGRGGGLQRFASLNKMFNKLLFLKNREIVPFFPLFLFWFSVLIVKSAWCFPPKIQTFAQCIWCAIYILLFTTDTTRGVPQVDLYVYHFKIGKPVRHFTLISDCQ